jgi:hypothetical protein
MALCAALDCHAAESACAVWKVGPGLWKIKPLDPSGPPDPFAEDRRTAAPALPKPAVEVYPQIVPALEPHEPVDVKSLFKTSGIALGKDDVALFSESAGELPIVFVRSSRENLALVDTTLTGSLDILPPQQAEITFHLRLRKPDGTQEELVKRSLLCRSGPGIKFQRHAGVKLMEEETVEVAVAEDGVTIDLNTSVIFQLDSVVKASGRLLLRSGDAAGMVLATVPASEGTLEVNVSARTSRAPWLEGNPDRPLSDLPKLARTIDAQLRMAAAIPPAARGDLYYLPDLTWKYPPGDFQSGAEPKTGKTINIPCMGPEPLSDAASRMEHLRVPFAPGDRALYSNESGLLYVRAGAATRACLGGMALEPAIAVQQMEVQFGSWQNSAEGKRTDFPARSLLVRSGSTSTSTAGAAGGPQEEKITVDGGTEGEFRQAHLVLTLSSFRMDNETWTLNTHASPPIDGNHPLTIASGMAKDSGGAAKHLSVSSRLRFHHWQELVTDPKRKQAALEEIEANLRNH